MNRRRTSARTLTGTRIYIRRGKYQYFSGEPMLNPKTGKVSKWHILCPVSDGELKARNLLRELLDFEVSGDGDFASWFKEWRKEFLAKRAKNAPKDPARLVIWDKGTKAIGYSLDVIADSFDSFDVAQIAPSDIAVFIDQWEGRRAAQSYRGYLVKFFAWACRRGTINTNPAQAISTEKPQKRDVYFTHDKYSKIKAKLTESHDQKMTALYMDLLYLFYQRGTDIRLLRHSEITDAGIMFKPTKTEKSSGAKVLVRMDSEKQAVIDRAKAIRKLDSMFVLHDSAGQPYSARRLYDVFKDACEAAEVSGVTLKDIRGMAATDAKNAGYSIEQIQVGLAHGDTGTTQGYIKQRDVPVSEIVLRLPK